MTQPIGPGPGDQTQLPNNRRNQAAQEQAQAPQEASLPVDRTILPHKPDPELVDKFAPFLALQPMPGPSKKPDAQSRELLKAYEDGLKSVQASMREALRGGNVKVLKSQEEFMEQGIVGTFLCAKGEDCYLKFDVMQNQEGHLCGRKLFLFKSGNIGVRQTNIDGQEYEKREFRPGNTSLLKVKTDDGPMVIIYRDGHSEPPRA